MLLAGSTRYFVFNVPSLRHSSDNLSASSHTRVCRESPPLRELACRKRRIETNTTDARLRVTAQRSSVQYTTLEPLSEFTCPTARAKNPNTLSLDRVFGFSKTCLSVTEPEIRIRSTGLFFFWFAFLLRHIMSVYREKT